MTRQEMENFIHATGNVSRPGLERITELMEKLGNPQNDVKFIHVAGTNGKGSTSAMMESVLRAAGYRTGLYTSPHLFRMSERIKVDGVEVTEEELCELAEETKRAVDTMDDKPTEFERITAMGFLYFKKRNCDIVVLEVGLGGRMDATNIIPAPEVAVIMNIALEHTNILGDTVEKIAFEKGGIIKAGTSVALYRQSAQAEGVIEALCRERGAKLRRAESVTLQKRSIDGQTFDCGAREGLSIALLGSHQLGNAATALAAIDALREKGWRISEEAVREGLAATRWGARLEVLHREPTVLLDGAHNPDGVTALSNALYELFGEEKLTLVMGVMADKDYVEMLELIAPRAKRVIATAPDYYRALSPKALADALAAKLSVPVVDGGSVENALRLVLDTTPANEAVCVFGSLYQAGEVRAFFGKE